MKLWKLFQRAPKKIHSSERVSDNVRVFIAERKKSAPEEYFRFLGENEWKNCAHVDS